MPRWRRSDSTYRRTDNGLAHIKAFMAWFGSLLQ
jgi:hypothetical protein